MRRCTRPRRKARTHSSSTQTLTPPSNARWPSRNQSEPEYRTAANILEELLPQIAEKLDGMGFQKDDYSPLLQVLNERLDNRQTGAQWQLDKLAALRKKLPQPEALQEMQSEYQSLSLQNIPVSRWPC